MPFGLKNALAIFSRVIVVAFKEFIHRFFEVYFDDLMVFRLVRKHVSSLHLMLDTCVKYQISINLTKCIFCVPYGILLGHVVCKKGFMVDPTKIVVVINLEPSRYVEQLRATLGHTRYYRKFIKAYVHITAAMEKWLKKDVTFCWDDDCHKSLDDLKEKMVTTPILVFLDWKKEFHVHFDASCIALGGVLSQPGVGDIDHLISFVRKNLSKP